ncbi:SRPBCC family protein [Amycolatopsis sp. NPDC059021]|uniref:SRPBCC family protein n=1 Tax=Amycolatopsis sp. NPDC059021 TaxID=3346704 RepID=UPI0036727586
MAGNEGQDGPIAKLREYAAKNPATEELLHAGEDFLQAKAQQLMSSAGRKLGDMTNRLTDAAENGDGIGTALGFGGKLAEGKSMTRAGIETAGKSLKDKITGLFRRGGRKSGSGGKMIAIVEDIDVGVPVREAYDQWTEYQKFSTFAKGVKSAERADDVTSNWKFKIFWSNRSMKATTTEQIPDQRIVWTTDGAKGTIKGVVTFHPLGENLTKVLLLIEYYPAGLFEKTANIWRAQGRRARLDLKHYRRFITMAGEASGEGWRGEIRDGEVVRTHEEAMEAEEAEQEEPEEYDEDEAPDDEEAEEPEEGDEPEEEPAEDEEEEPSAEGDEDYDEEEPDYDEEDEREPAGAR